MTIAFIHAHKSFLPGLQAYIDFFSAYGIKTEIFHPREHYKISADIEWHFLGINRNKKKDSLLIHEYTSASVPPFYKEKNLLKRLINIRPDYNLFQNEYVKQSLGFNDNTPFGYRDVGIGDSFFNVKKNITKDFDFVYTGNIDRLRGIENLLQCFTKGDLKNKTLLVLSKGYETLANKFASYQNIRFKGPVAYDNVGDYISKARFCINFMPDREPFNQQTSTKLIEYVALKVPIISSRYAWVENFQNKYGGDFFYLEKNLSNFTWENVNNYNYSFPDMHEWRWEKQIRKSGVLEFMQSRFAGLQF